MTSIVYSKDRVLLQLGGLDSKASMPQRIMATPEDNTQRRPAKKLATACLCPRAPPNFLLPDEVLNQRGEPFETDFPSPSHVHLLVLEYNLYDFHSLFKRSRALAVRRS
jgi:hypothetical protein